MFSAGSEIITNKLNGKEYAIVSTTTYEFVEMALNWYKSLTLIGLEKYAVVIAYDLESYEFLNSKNVSSAYLNIGFFPRSTQGEWFEMEKRTNHLGAKVIFSNFDINLIRTDTDIFFFKDFISKFNSEASLDYDMLACSDKRYDPFTYKRIKNHIVTVNNNLQIENWGESDQSKYGDTNGTICYVPLRSRDKVIKFHDSLIDPEYIKKFPQNDYSGCAQRLWNHAVKEQDLRVKILSIFEFTNGSVWKVQYLREEIKDRVYSVHYNFHSNAEPLQRFKDKKQAMIENGHWLL